MSSPFNNTLNRLHEIQNPSSQKDTELEEGELPKS